MPSDDREASTPARVAPRREVEAFAQLVAIMQRLREPGGCPWDAEQTHQSIKKYLIEEAHEAVEAIEGGSDSELCDELGDLLLQVVFHAQMAAERGAFTIEDVARGLCEKLVRRHPHVFAEVSVASSAEVVTNWARIKEQERLRKASVAKTRASALDGVPRSLPALLRAHRLGQKAASVGFDWKSPDGVREKIDEELGEIESARRRGSAAEIGSELGDLLLAVASYARLLGHDAESVLREAVDRFDRRFRCLECDLLEQGRAVSETDAGALEIAWEKVKARE